MVGDRALNQAQKAFNSRAEQRKVAKKFAEEFDNSQAFKEHLEESIYQEYLSQDIRLSIRLVEEI